MYEKKLAKNINPKNEFYIQWHFLERCNLRCVHCYQEHYDSRELPREKLFIIAKIMSDTLKKWGKIGRISLTGGEPFTQTDMLIDLIDYFNNTDQFGKIGILTNGTLIDNAVCQRLASFEKLYEIQVSLDGSNPGIHDQIRGKGSFSKALDGIEVLKKYDFFVSIMFTLHNLNQHDVLRVIDLAEQLNVDAITIERFTPMNIEDIEKLYIPPERLKIIYNEIYIKKMQIEKRSNLKIRVSRPLWTLVDENLGAFL